MLAVFFRSHSDIYLFSFSLHDNGNFKNVRAYVEYRVVYEKLKMCSFRSTNRPYAFEMVPPAFIVVATAVQPMYACVFVLLLYLFTYIHMSEFEKRPLK